MPYYIPDSTFIYEVEEFKPVSGTTRFQFKISREVYCDEEILPDSRQMRPGQVISITPLLDFTTEEAKLQPLEKHPNIANTLSDALAKFNFLRQRRKENSEAKVKYLTKDIDLLKKPLGMDIFEAEPDVYVSPFTDKIS